jgi:alpha-beta hydrolase superfamily lysophospholipase
MLTTPSPPSDVSIPSPDGLVLLGRHWARPNPRGVVIVAHGFGEHGGCYRHVAEALGPALEVDFVAPDLRGHGRSPGRRGVVGRYEELTSDLRAVLAWAESERPGLPRFVLGHSNGGQVALRLALEDGDRLAGLILSNPSLHIVVPVPRYKLRIGRFLLRFAPGVTLAGKVADDWMTRDPEMRRAHQLDTLRHSRISAPLFFGMVDGGPLIEGRAGEIRVPVLMLLGGSDPVIDANASRRIFASLGSLEKTLIVYPEMLHEPLNELGRERVFADVASWLEERF